MSGDLYIISPSLARPTELLQLKQTEFELQTCRVS